MVSETQLTGFQAFARSTTEFFHAYGTHGTTSQPDLAPLMIAILDEEPDPCGSRADLRERRSAVPASCAVNAEGCVNPSCCD